MILAGSTFTIFSSSSNIGFSFTLSSCETFSFGNSESELFSDFSGEATES